MIYIPPTDPQSQLALVVLVDRLGNKIADLPAVQVQDFSEELNMYGTANLTCPTLSPEAQLINTVKQEIQIYLRGELAWWGVPWRVDGDHQTTTFGCDGLLSYFVKRYLTYTSLQYDNIDQHTIAWNLLSHTQALTDGNFHITASFSPSGVNRYRKYKRDEHPNIWDSIKEFPGLNNGFDFDLVFDETGLRRWTPYYPRKGSFKPALRMEWGKNIYAFTYKEDGIPLANHVYVTGGSNGEVKFENNYRNDDSAEEYGVFHDVISEGSQNDVNWLLARATKEATKRGSPLIVPELTAVHGMPGVAWSGGLVVGDTVPIEIDHGRAQFRDTYRIAKRTWNSNDTISYTIEEEVAA